MRTLILLDKDIDPVRRPQVDAALARLRDDYAPATPFTWDYETRDFSALQWVEYQPNFKGISFDTVLPDTKAIFVRDGEKWDNIIYVVDIPHWQEPHAWGWNLGPTIHTYAVELVRYNDNPDWLYKTFAMEIAHSWNDMGIQEIGDNLLAVFGVTDFDNMVVHGVDPRYGKNVPPNAPITGYYTDYNYRPMIAIAQDQLRRMYQTRLDRYTSGTYKFWRDLYFGKSGDDVAELQRRLAREGDMEHAATGFFGQLTRAAATKYQAAHGITPAVGFVGPITRTSLNGSLPPPPRKSGGEPEPALAEEIQIWG